MKLQIGTSVILALSKQNCLGTMDAYDKYTYDQHHIVILIVTRKYDLYNKKKVSMTRKCHNHILQTKPWHYDEENQHIKAT